MPISAAPQADCARNSAIDRARRRTSSAPWQRTIAINLSMPFYLSRASLPGLRKFKGAIVNITSDWGLKGGPNAVAYCARFSQRPCHLPG